MENRYVVTIEMHIWAEDDLQAMKKADYIEKTGTTDEAANFLVTSIVEQPYGTIGNREVYKP